MDIRTQPFEIRPAIDVIMQQMPKEISTGGGETIFYRFIDFSKYLFLDS